ncbi:TolC family protein [Lishizhenia sp.]|uniref:TolC family protein n=1 Tax=Lishizhenia sp. TaxID=2497594 RepID=UPI00299D2A53|nr:TolC family protein [Lishizhenia sp.]MDX1445409.1 TolC family protein [Lishizhenia sp.]
MKQLICIGLLFPFLLVAQTQLQDSSNTFSYEEYMNVVMQHHPMAYQAQLKLESGDAYLQKGRGGFDPKLLGDAQQKYYDGKQYYSYLHGGLKVPTWFGIELMAGYDNNMGYRLNEESYTPDLGLWNAGIAVNLGQGLFIDQRRADLKQAKLMQQNTVQEQKLMLNELKLQAAQAYFDWYKAYTKRNLLEDNLSLVQVRLINLRESVKYGDIPAVDTLKASIQVQDRKLKFMQAEVELTNKRIWLNTYLWQDGFLPLEVDSLQVPALNSVAQPALVDLENTVDTHPEILLFQNDIRGVMIDTRMKREALKPKFEVKYNALGDQTGNGILQDYTLNNYKWGATFAYPIFTRKERANVKLNEIKLETQESKLLLKKTQLSYKIESVQNSLNNTIQQIAVQERAVEMYQSLLDAEQSLFDAGESSQFLINTRDQNLLAARIKLIELYYTRNMLKAQLDYVRCNL